MCVIIALRPGQMLPRSMLNNAVYNNWHSYGLVTRIDGKLDITRVVPQSGEVDPAEVWEALERDKKYERILHLRHNTAGATNLENCHPFDVYYSSSKRGVRQVVFMHNGTMYGYKSKKKDAAGNLVDDDDGSSDTKNFVDKVLTPILSGTDFGHGHGDIENDLTKKILDRMWPEGENRGILIANDQDALIFGKWSTIKPSANDSSTHFLASNDTYFHSITRGPELTRQIAKREAEKRAAKSQSSSTRTEVVPLKNFVFERPIQFTTSQPLSSVLNDYRFYDRDTTVNIGYATHEELKELIDLALESEAGKTDLLAVCEWVFTDYTQLYEEHQELQASYEKLVEKHKKATDHIATMSEQMKKIKKVG